MNEYFSPMPRHRRRNYSDWAAAIVDALNTFPTTNLARTLNSAALLFYEHSRPSSASNLLIAQSVLVGSKHLGSNDDFDSIINLVKVSVRTSNRQREHAIRFWTQGDTRICWAFRNHASALPAIVDAVIQELLRLNDVFVMHPTLTELARRDFLNCPSDSQTLRLEFFQRLGMANEFKSESFQLVVSPLAHAYHNGEVNLTPPCRFAPVILEGLRTVTERIDHTWWRAILGAAHLVSVPPSWFVGIVSHAIDQEPLLGLQLPHGMRQQLIHPRASRNVRLSDSQLKSLDTTIWTALNRISPAIQADTQSFKRELFDALGASLDAPPRGQT